MAGKGQDAVNQSDQGESGPGIITLIRVVWSAILEGFPPAHLRAKAPGQMQRRKSRSLCE